MFLLHGFVSQPKPVEATAIALCKLLVKSLFHFVLGHGSNKILDYQFSNVFPEYAR